MHEKFSQHTNSEMLRLASISAQRLARLVELNAPTVIINRERSLLNERLDEIALRKAARRTLINSTSDNN